MQTADCRPGVKCRLRIKTVSLLIRDSMSSKTYFSALFRGHFSPTLALLWNIPCSFLRTICLSQTGQATGYLSAAYLICQLNCRSPKGRYAAECEESRRLTFKDGHVLCHLSSISYCALLFLKIDMTARAQSEKI